MNLDMLKKINDYEWLIERQGEMNVPGIIFGMEKVVQEMDDKVYEQCVNVASLPGIVKASLVMPDGHWGYGFPIGGVAAFEEENGILSVGGVGFDINCGVRTMTTPLRYEDIKDKIKTLVDYLFKKIPAGLGSRGKIKLTRSEVNEVLVEGAKWVVEKGFGTEEDLEYIEEKGCVPNADPSCVSEKAIKREKGQIGTLGSGNHYLEVQVVDKIFDEKVAKSFGLFEGQVVITFHCGSRALGHQIGCDYLPVLAEASRKYGIKIREEELVCAPIKSKEGEKYFKAVNCGINYAFANRQVIAGLIRECIEKMFKVEVKTLYDVGHNTCKVEYHNVDGEKMKLYVHRKGATRAFGPGRKEIPAKYRDVGQPVIIGGSMGSYSYILVGTDYAMEKSFGSTCHGAGRSMSRTQAKKKFWGESIIKALEKQGIYVRAHSLAGVAEEAPQAYKDVDLVIESVHLAGLSTKVARLRPVGNIKG